MRGQPGRGHGPETAAPAGRSLVPVFATGTRPDPGDFYWEQYDNKAVRRAVTTGAVTKQGIAITAGLSGTEQVVLRSGGFLSPGETINPQPQKK